MFVLSCAFSGACPFCAFIYLFFIIQYISIYLCSSNPFVFSDLSIPPFEKVTPFLWPVFLVSLLSPIFSSGHVCQLRP